MQLYEFKPPNPTLETNADSASLRRHRSAFRSTNHVNVIVPLRHLCVPPCPLWLNRSGIFTTEDTESTERRGREQRSSRRLWSNKPAAVQRRLRPSVGFRCRWSGVPERERSPKVVLAADCFGLEYTAEAGRGAERTTTRAAFRCIASGHDRSLRPSDHPIPNWPVVFSAPRRVSAVDTPPGSCRADRSSASKGRTMRSSE